jgi:hypothetical protein
MRLTTISRVEILMDRPLRGTPCIFEKMYGRQGLSSVACMDLSDKGGCMLAQIVETVRTKTRKDVKCHSDAQARSRETAEEAQDSRGDAALYTRTGRC